MVGSNAPRIVPGGSHDEAVALVATLEDPIVQGIQYYADKLPLNPNTEKEGKELCAVVAFRLFDYEMRPNPAKQSLEAKNSTSPSSICPSLHLSHRKIRRCKSEFASFSIEIIGNFHFFLRCISREVNKTCMHSRIDEANMVICCHVRPRRQRQNAQHCVDAMA